VGHVGEINREQAELRMMDQYEEQDQAYQGANQQQQTEEETLARSYTIDSTVTWHNISHDSRIFVIDQEIKSNYEMRYIHIHAKKQGGRSLHLAQ